jgi:glycosyltransferase involved in cell wall biosynthesis
MTHAGLWATVSRGAWWHPRAWPHLTPVAALIFAAAIAVLLLALLLRARGNFLSLPELFGLPGPAPQSLPDCMVIVPARNEAACIGRAVSSLPHDTVIVVDDASEDATAEEARKAGAGVLPAPPLPPGAVGKSHACMAGARLIASRWILFADASTWYEEGFLPAAVQFAESNALDFVSFLLEPRPQDLAGRILIPYARALFFCGVNPRSEPALAFHGQCVLVRRQAYEFVAGHKSLLKHLVEDCRMAELAAMHRMKFAVVRTALGHGNAYPGMRGLWEWMERAAFRFGRAGNRRGEAIVAAATIAALWPVAAGGLYFTGRHAAAALFLLFPLPMLERWYRGWRVALAPLGVYLMLPFLMHGAIGALTSLQVRWKGRVVSIS